MRLSNLEIMLEKALLDEPKAPLARKILFNNSTSIAIRNAISKGAHSFAIASDEAGNVFNSQTATDLTFFNDGYSGTPIRVERKSTPSFVVKDYAMTVMLMAQESVMRDFVGRKKGAARGNGSLSRFYIAQPESMRGYKFQNTDAKSRVNIDKFQERISNLLNMLDMRLQENNDGSIADRITIKLSAKAEELYVQFSNMLQMGMQPGRYFCDDKDLASRAAENASRLACLFHVYEHGLEGEIDTLTFDRAATITLWFLFESKRVLDDFSRAQEESDAQLLYNWLRMVYTNTPQQPWQPYCTIPLAQIYLHCRPNKLRSKSVLIPAIQALADRGIVQYITHPKPAYLVLHASQFNASNHLAGD